jgi:hypothetical protein
VRKKQDKIDGLFRDYFAGGPDKKHKVSEDSSFQPSICACESMAVYEREAPLPSKAKCPDVARLGAYIDGSLDKSGIDLLEIHISCCKKCREKVRQAKSAIELFEKGALPEAFEIVSAEELSRLTKRNPQKK